MIKEEGGKLLVKNIWMKTTGWWWIVWIRWTLLSVNEKMMDEGVLCVLDELCWAFVSLRKVRGRKEAHSCCARERVRKRDREIERKRHCGGFACFVLLFFSTSKFPQSLEYRRSICREFFNFFPIFIDPFAVENCFLDVPLFVSSVVEEPSPPGPQVLHLFFGCCSVCCIFRLLLLFLLIAVDLCGALLANLLCSSCFASGSGFSIEKNIMVGMLMDMLPSACAVLVSFAVSACNCSLP